VAIDTPLLERQEVWAAKLETSTGVPIALTAADGAFNVFDPSIEPDIAFGRRQGQGASIDPIAGVPGARGANVSLKTEAYGAATVPAWGILLLAAGATLTGRTYNFTTATMNDATLTTGYYQSGALLQASGVTLNWKLRGQNGQVIMSEWDGKGLWQPPTSVALIAPTYPTTAPLRAAGMTFTVGTVPYKFDTFELDLGNNVVYREAVNDSGDQTGYHAACITDRNIRLSISPERVPLGTKDWYADYLAGAEAAVSIVAGLSANNIITLTLPKMQLAEAPKPGTRNGIRVDNLVFQANRSASAGDDALSAAFS
jgi:hypothetical protein